MADDKYTQSKAYDALNPRGLAGKREYVRGLEQRRDEEALSLLVECLCDESWFLRDLAEEAMLRIGDRGVSVLIPLLEQGLWFTRTSAARIVGKLGRRDAVPMLLRLTEDANATVADAARSALMLIGRSNGAIAVARALHRLPPDLRRRRFDELSTRDRHLGERIDRMMRNDDLMADKHGDRLSDDCAEVRASEEGVEWEVLTAPAPKEPRPEPVPERGERPPA
jgi:HEAT repeat protein